MLMLETILNYRLDSLCFGVLLMTVAIAVHGQLRRRHGTGLTLPVWCTLAALIVVGTIVPEMAGERERSRLRAMLSGIAPTYAQELELLGHDQLSFESSPEDPRYLAMIRAQIRWETINLNVSDIYTFRKNAEGKVGFIVDSETDYDRNGVFGEEREQRTPIGEEYPEPTEAMLLALDGVATFDDVPYTDRWGTWISAFSPLYDADGRISGALGVDYAARQWLTAIVWSRLAALVFVTVLAVMILASTVIVIITRAELIKREALERQRAELQDQLIATSRQAGMAEVATGVLHNVGNVLTSINVSARMVTECLRASRLTGLGKVVGLIEQERPRLAEFVTADPRGKQVPDLLTQLYSKLCEDHDTVQREVDQLVTGIEHIKEVVRMQQVTADTSSNVLTPTDAIGIFEDAIKVNLMSMERHDVNVHRDFESGMPLFPLDKHKVLQILINLISNAKKATCHPSILERHITLRVRRMEQGQSLQFEVQDNGIGIAADDLTKLFRHGYTRFERGHGFGLHSAANAAGEMKGTLTVSSPGVDQGATFTLTVPVTLAQYATQEAA